MQMMMMTTHVEELIGDGSSFHRWPATSTASDMCADVIGRACMYAFGLYNVNRFWCGTRVVWILIIDIKELSEDFIPTIDACHMEEDHNIYCS